MSSTPTPWDPQAPEVQRDQRAAFDQLRARWHRQQAGKPG